MKSELNAVSPNIAWISIGYTSVKDKIAIGVGVYNFVYPRSVGLMIFIIFILESEAFIADVIT
jgi:hypothetical protein